MWIVGLTGAIGAGKSTLSGYFQSFGIPVFCSDEAIHQMLKSDFQVTKRLREVWPNVFVEGEVSRHLLGGIILDSPKNLRLLEDILYPQLARQQKDFLQYHYIRDAPIVVLDVPLLIEVGLHRYCHYVMVASAPFSLRKKRVLKRSGMSLERFNFLESQQMSEKKRLTYADVVIPTGRPKHEALKRIEEIIEFLSHTPSPSWNGDWPTHLQRESYD